MKTFEDTFLGLYNSTESASLEIALSELRRVGASQRDCVKVLVSELKVSIKDADLLVLNSDTWGDNKHETESLRDIIDQEIQECLKDTPQTTPAAYL